MSMCVFVPCDPVSVSESLWHLVQVCLVPSPNYPVFKTPVHSVNVLSVLERLPCLCSLFPGKLKSCVCEFLVSSFRFLAPVNCDSCQDIKFLFVFVLLEYYHFNCILDLF